jgi:two-component system response regulator RpaA
LVRGFSALENIGDFMIQNILTTGQCAQICKVSPRTVSIWFDSGRLRGYRIPGSQDRRIPKEYLLRFMLEHGIPIPDAMKDGE